MNQNETVGTYQTKLQIKYWKNKIHEKREKPSRDLEENFGE